MDDHVSHALYWGIGIAIGVPLLIFGDRFRRRTRGRIRHIEVHLLAWLPALILEAAMYIQVPFPLTFSQVFAVPLINAAFVYLWYFASILVFRVYGDGWERSEEKLDQQDALAQKEKQRRARIESYKHKHGDRSADKH